MAMIGHVTSSYRSPNLGRSFALAMVKDGAGAHRAQAVRAAARPHGRGDRHRARSSSTRKGAAACLSRLPRQPALSAERLRPRGIRLGERALGKIELRGDPGDRAFMAAVGRALDLLLPVEPNSSADQERASPRSGSGPMSGS